MPDPVTSLDEIRALLAHLPGPDLDAGGAAAAREARLTKPAGALGRLEELAGWLAARRARHPPRVERPRTRAVARQHGVAPRVGAADPRVRAPQSPAPRWTGNARWSRPRSPATGRRRATRSRRCAGWAGSNSPRWSGRSWRRAWAGSRSCSTGSRLGPPPRCSTPPTRGRSII